MKIDFSWTGIHLSGKKMIGKINAENKIIAQQKLENDGITVLSIKKNNAAFHFLQKDKLTDKLKLDFTQQLQLLLQASIPLADALLLISNTSPNDTIHNIASQLKEKIIAGMNFSAALSDFPSCFDQPFCQMIAAGENSGQLDIVLTQLIENQEQRSQLKNKISKALFYPLSVMSIAMVITIGLLIFVIPQFSAIYDNFNAQLPALTRCLITLSHHLIHHGLFYLAIMMPCIFYIKKISKKLFFKIPFFRSLTMMQQIAQWSQLLAMTLSSGIPLIDALHIAHQTISQPLLQGQLQEVRNAVITGKSLHAALAECHYFPARAKAMIAIGENADSLSWMMKKIATVYQQQLNNTLDRLSKLLEPVIMIVVASVVSGLIIAMYLPIFKMGSIVSV